MTTPGVETWTPPDGAERLTAKLGGRVLPPRERPPAFHPEPGQLDAVAVLGGRARGREEHATDG